jgi:hypothetical protein
MSNRQKLQMYQISFSRGRILHNIPVSRGILPRNAAKPPILVESQAKGKFDNWVFGLRLDSSADIYYRARRKPHQAWMETAGNIHEIAITMDEPKRSKDLMYIYVQLSRIGKDEPALTVHLYRFDEGKWAWRSYCAWDVKIAGPSRIMSSLGRPLPWTAPGDTGARVWVETSGTITAGSGEWFMAKSNKPWGRRGLIPRWHASIPEPPRSTV